MKNRSLLHKEQLTLASIICLPYLLLFSIAGKIIFYKQVNGRQIGSGPFHGSEVYYNSFQYVELVGTYYIWMFFVWKLSTVLYHTAFATFNQILI